MNTFEIKYQGNLRTTATHLDSGSEISTDAPKDNHGLGEAFSPTDMVCSALASCILTIMAIAVEKTLQQLLKKLWETTLEGFLKLKLI
jgi:putative redox protein